MPGVLLQMRSAQIVSKCTDIEHVEVGTYSAIGLSALTSIQVLGQPIHADLAFLNRRFGSFLELCNR